MSYHVSIQIYCDAPDCHETFYDARVNRGGLSKTWVGHIAVTHGWYIPGRPGTHDPKRALCPKHHPARPT